MHHLGIMALVQTIGYPGITAVVFFESGVFFGFFLPGASMLFTAGLLSSKGVFNPWILIPLVTVAAIAGDSVGYWFGKKVGRPLFLRGRSRWFRPEHLAHAHAFYEKHGARTVFFARFIPIVRTFVPIVAGAAEMSYKTFLVYNVVGAIVWAAGTTFLGYFLGERVPFIGHYLTPIILIIIAVTCLPLLWDFIKKKPVDEI